MARLSYHTSMLESAMADMQRAINSKRAIAEITLTRMCDTRLSQSSESLSLRIDELEKAVKMLKLGVPSMVTEQHGDADDSVKIEYKTEQKAREPQKIETTPKNALSVYAEWGCVLKKIAELKRSLSAGFAGASVYTDGIGHFVIRMSPFFSEKLKSSETDIAIVKGVIAENEGKNVSEITVSVESNVKSSGSFTDLEDMFK